MSQSKVFLVWALFVLVSLGAGLWGVWYVYTFKIEKPLMVSLERTGRLFLLSSPVFENGSRIPKKYTCDGENISPPLKIDGIKRETKVLALLVEDVDTPEPWVHWLVWNIPVTNLIEEGKLPWGSVEGKNSWGRNKYSGPCPPFGRHRYYFRVFALKDKLSLSRNATKKEFLDALQDKVLDKAQFYGVYER